MPPKRKINEDAIAKALIIAEGKARLRRITEESRTQELAASVAAAAKLARRKRADEELKKKRMSFEEKLRSLEAAFEDRNVERALDDHRNKDVDEIAEILVANPELYAEPPALSDEASDESIMQELDEYGHQKLEFLEEVKRYYRAPGPHRNGDLSILTKSPRSFIAVYFPDVRMNFMRKVFEFTGDMMSTLTVCWLLQNGFEFQAKELIGDDNAELWQHAHYLKRRRRYEVCWRRLPAVGLYYNEKLRKVIHHFRIRMILWAEKYPLIMDLASLEMIIPDWRQEVTGEFVRND